MSLSELQEVVGGYNKLWEDIGVMAYVRNVREDGRGLRAELQITSQNPGTIPLLYHNQISLLSARPKKELAKDLEGRLPLAEIYQGSVPSWVDRIEYLAHLVVMAHRKGQPVQQAGETPIRQSQAYRVKPFLPEGVATVMFGDGGSGKSYLALLLSLLVETGERRLGLEVQQGKVMYLDYETSYDDVNERIRALCKGLDLGEGTLSYRRCEMPLVREIERIGKLVEKYGIDLVVLDSVGLSLDGSGNKDEVVNHQFTALRTLGCTVLMVDHIAKLTEGMGSPWGVAYKSNSARSVWRVKGTADFEASSLSVGLWHTKVNEGRPWPPLGFHFQFENNDYNRVVNANVARQDVAGEFFADMSGTDKIVQLLKEQGKMDVADIISETGGDDNKIRVDLTRLKRRGIVDNPTRGVWCLVERRQEIEF